MAESYILLAFISSVISIGYHSFSKIWRIFIFFETMALSLNAVIAMNLSKHRSLQHCGLETVFSITEQ